MEETSQRKTSKPGAYVSAVQEGLVRIYSDQTSGENRPFTKNEIIYIMPKVDKVRKEKIMCEVLRVKGNWAEAQVFEPTAGITIGDEVEHSGLPLSISLGPGLLGKVFDGLQLPLKRLADDFGYFLPRGVDYAALDAESKWEFEPVKNAGDLVTAGDVLGYVMEGKFKHKAMVPFAFTGEHEIVALQRGEVTTDTEVATLKNKKGEHKQITLKQQWSIRDSIPAKLLSKNKNERLLPTEPMLTTIRMVDTFFPIAKGGSACIPGPFGAGKTVLQSLISKYSNVDIVVVVACGERAGEVVELINEFPKIIDPKTGGSLMDRTVIICNTSSMPVAAREASIYTGITIGEYYRQMGYDVMLIADSTSRWAQAMRETSGRMEEIPGEEGFPAYIDSTIRSVYERAGVIKTNDGGIGSLTMIGTVSPAGGNFEEPITQSTLSTVKTFLGLSYARAYKRFYPAIDPLISWSRYLEQLKSWFMQNLDPDWNHKVNYMYQTLVAGDKVEQMMQVTGEEGISLSDYIVYHKSKLIDVVYLQQDAFDKVDASVPIERQHVMFNSLYNIALSQFNMATKQEGYKFFTALTAKFKNLNYAEQDSKEYHSLNAEIKAMVVGGITQVAAEADIE